MKKTLLVVLTLVLCLNAILPVCAEDAWICPACGRENTSRFCPECGMSMETALEMAKYWTCPNCCTQNEGKFCTGCGTPKEGSAAAVPTVAPTATPSYSQYDAVWNRGDQYTARYSYPESYGIVLKPDLLQNKTTGEFHTYVDRMIEKVRAHGQCTIIMLPITYDTRYFGNNADDALIRCALAYCYLNYAGMYYNYAEEDDRWLDALTLLYSGGTLSQVNIGRVDGGG